MPENQKDHLAVGPVAQSLLNTNILDGSGLNGWTRVDDAGLLVAQIIATAGISAGAIIFEGTNDVTATPITLPVQEYTASITPPAAVAAAITIAASTARIFMVPVRTAFVRCRISTAFVGGTIRAVTMFDRLVSPLLAQAVAAIVGQTAHDAPITGLPVRIGARARSSNFTGVANDDAIDLITSTVGALITKDFSIPELDWSYAVPAGGLITTADAVLQATAGAGLRRYLTGLQIRNASGTVATEVVIKSAATIIWRGQFPINSPIEDVVFASPLKTAANEALNAACITTGAAVYVNAQGYTAP